MKRAWAILFCLSLFAVMGSQAQNYQAKSPYQTPAAPSPGAGPDAACPWFTQGSAARVLGGTVRVLLSLTNASEGSCTFVRTDDPHDQLRVVVGAERVPACPAGSVRVIGVGSEARRCRLPVADHGVTQMVSGRVHALHMAVTLSGAANTAASGTATGNDDAIEQIAEQVAGNLF